MQGIGFAIVGAIQRLFRVGIYSDNNFYDEMADDYHTMPDWMFDKVYGSNWAEKHSEGLMKGLDRYHQANPHAHDNEKESNHE